MVSQELRAVSEALRANRVLTGSLLERRASMEAATAGLAPPDTTEVVPADAGGVPCEWIAAEGAAPDRVVLYLHGGAYTAGSLGTHRLHVGNLSAVSGARVLNVDYRLAPEHAHPAAVDDACTAYRWLLGTGVEPGRVVVAGDSAGGGLAAAMLVALRDAGDPLPAGGALISPWTDLTLTAPSLDSRADVDPMVSKEGLAPSAEAYLGGADPKTPTASPRFADLAGLPPLCIHVGDHEVLLDDAVALAEAAGSAGVDVELWVAPEMIHVWHAFAGLVPEGAEAMDRLGAWIRASLA
jgi:monoterpene epsilon-lactone hydrolase